jgi:hypothetical protein
MQFTVALYVNVSLGRIRPGAFGMQAQCLDLKGGQTLVDVLGDCP